jgi:hypothetical protein
MNLNNLKPAWRQFRLMNSIPRMDQNEILFILESAESMAVSKTNRLVVHAMVFIVLTFFCQGG